MLTRNRDSQISRLNLRKALSSMVGRLRGSQRELERNIQDLKLVQGATSRLAAIVESSHDAIIGKTLDGIITSWNPGAEALYGYSAEEVMGRSITILSPPEQPDEITRIMEELRHGGSLDHFETARITKQGKRIFVSLTISPIRDDSGVTSGFSTIARDITERKASAEARKRSELRYRRLFESAKDGILILDANSGKIIDVNPFLIEMLAYSKEELMGRELWEIGVFEDEIHSKAAFVELQEQGYIRYDDLPLKTRAGVVKQVEFVSNSYLVDGSPVIQCNIRDITERKESEQTLKETNQRLERVLAELQGKRDELTGMTQQLWQASKLVTMGELAASVAHELNNPLATISLRLDSLATELVHDKRESHDLKIVLKEVERMGNLVAGLLQFGRRSHQQISTIDICKEIENALELTEYYFRSHKIEIVRKFDCSIPPVHADREQLRQVFLNLMTNASDAMPEGGTLTISARTQADDEVKSIRIELADSGPGIAPADMEKLWEPFFTTKPEGKGTGLGLAICRRVVEEHHGTIAIESWRGKGTTVSIILPATNGGLEEPIVKADSS
ncbi:MAG TPA: PAS domain S-box protein [Pyrinomonadaceae bacterium]|nr:PAS domain S-box protein [Pyrinomonadaceae bacterium]